MRYWPVYGGGETVTRILANELANRDYGGIKNKIYIFYVWDRTDGQNVSINSSIITKKIDGIPYQENNNDINKEYYDIISKYLENYISDNAIDIVINQWLPHKSVIKAVKKTNAKLITCHHTMIRCDGGRKSLRAKIFYGIFNDFGALWRNWPVLRKPVKESNRFVCLCKAYADDVKHLYHIPQKSDKVVAIENPINTSSATEDLIPNKEHSVVFVEKN